MKKLNKTEKIKLLTYSIILIILGLILVFLKPNTVRAFGDLVVDFHVPANQPIFTVTNMAPGQVETRNVDVHNAGTVTRQVAVKGIKDSGDDSFAGVLNIVIKEGSTDRYGGTTGTKTLSNFFADSAGNGILLSQLNSGASTTYTFQVTFPISAGNEFQNRQIVFDITFGKVTGDNLVINEVYYQVDNQHGFDSAKDRGFGSGKVGNINVNISNNGAGSKNTATINVNTGKPCPIAGSSNSASISNSVSINSNTGGSKASGNTGGSTSINSGSSNVGVNINNNVNQNNGNQNGCGQNNEWVELYNPTDHDISLKNWSLSDNSGAATKINANKIIKAGGFALLSKDASTWKFWTIPASALKVELGSDIGDGLDNGGDRLILKNSLGVVVDSLSYGSDTSVFNPSIPLVGLGDSFERQPTGFDTNSASDFVDRHPPTPGS